MIKTIYSIRGAKVVHQDTGETLALLNLPIIDPDTGVIEAFWVKPLTLMENDAVLTTSNILSFKKNLYIASNNVLAEAADLVRIATILEDGRLILGARVESESGYFYGRVYNLSFSTETYLLKQLHVQRAFLFFGFNRRLFPYDRIVKVLADKIIINDDSRVEVDEKVPSIPAELA